MWQGVLAFEAVVVVALVLMAWLLARPYELARTQTRQGCRCCDAGVAPGSVDCSAYLVPGSVAGAVV